jgi:hypothetical protein
LYSDCRDDRRELWVVDALLALLIALDAFPPAVPACCIAVMAPDDVQDPAEELLEVEELELLLGGTPQLSASAGVGRSRPLFVPVALLVTRSTARKRAAVRGARRPRRGGRMERMGKAMKA